MCFSFFYFQSTQVAVVATLMAKRHHPCLSQKLCCFRVKILKLDGKLVVKNGTLVAGLSIWETPVT